MGISDGLAITSRSVQYNDFETKNRHIFISLSERLCSIVVVGKFCHKYSLQEGDFVRSHAGERRGKDEKRARVSKENRRNYCSWPLQTLLYHCPACRTWLRDGHTATAVQRWTIRITRMLFFLKMRTYFNVFYFSVRLSLWYVRQYDIRPMTYGRL